MSVRQWLANSVLVQGLSRVAEAKPHELFAGVEKPTITLARMLAAEMLQNIDCGYRANNAVGSYDIRRWELSLPSCDIEVRQALGLDGKPRGERETTIRLKTRENLSGDAERIIILEAFDTFLKLRKRKAAMTAEEKRQQAALDAIEHLFKPKVIEAPKPAPDPLPAFDAGDILSTIR